MRDPQRFIDDNTHPELKRLLEAAKDDGPPPPVAVKQRVQSAVLAHLRARDEVRQSGVRRIGSIATERNMPTNAAQRTLTRPYLQERSWADQLMAYFAVAAAFVVVMVVVRQAYVSYANHTPPTTVPRNVTPQAPEIISVPAPNDLEEHRATITVVEEQTPFDQNENDIAEYEDVGPLRELVLKLKHRVHKSGTPQVVIRSSCSDPNDWLRSTELDYPNEAYNAGVSAAMNVTCNLSANGSFSGCVAPRPSGFTAADTGNVLKTMNSWTLAQSMSDWGSRTRRCKIEVIFDIGTESK